ncbi:MAG: Spy/CpxP family protein refolding chaperone, partial [Paramuribaculum sp.]|nr:Spy/CpxP family protein refolding chaperone [Paramuribaculum sp.]
PPVCNPIEGLNLTDAQKQQLSEICPFGPGKDKKDRKDRKEFDGKKSDKRDKAQAPGQRRKFSPEQADSMRRAMMTKRIDARKDYLAKVKDILTPEQYVQFLENSFVNAMPQMSGRNKGIKPGQRPGNNKKMGQQNGRKQRPRGQRPAPQN